MHNHTKLLSWKVFVTPGVATVSDDLPPGEAVRMWSPISSTLIYGERDAVLVDAPTTVEQAAALADWVVDSGKNVTTIYALMVTETISSASAHCRTDSPPPGRSPPPGF